MMDMMFVQASMEKASGISVVEASASEEQNCIGMSLELRKRKEWCERINAQLGTSFQVEEAYDAPTGYDTVGDSGSEEADPRDEDGDKDDQQQD